MKLISMDAAFVILAQLATADSLAVDLETGWRKDPLASHQRFCDDLMADAERQSRLAGLPLPDRSRIERRCDGCLQRHCRGYDSWLARKSDEQAAEIREIQDWCLQNSVTLVLDTCRRAFHWPLREK